jgi:septum formation protein
MLKQAGVAIEICVAAIDESTIKESLRAEGIAVERVAEALAETKARRVAARFPGCFVLGADQMLEIEGEWPDKPVDIAEARRQLQQLRGRSHRLVSSAVLIKDETRIWHHSSEAYLRMRDFSDAFLDDYLTKNSPQILTSVGAYQLEGQGAQLFDRIDGDFFTILGLPLLPVLAQLRQHGLIAT